MIIKNTKPVTALHVYLSDEDADSDIYINEIRPYQDAAYIRMTLDEAEKVLDALSQCIATLKARQEG
jgi:hypothetical protein